MDIDDNYIWERRIHHGIRYHKGRVPFPESVAIGLEFNAGLERKEKLDPSLLTNGVMMELCAFAKTVTGSEKYFVFELLEFNFELGLDVDNDMQCYEYATRVHTKVKALREQIKNKPNRWKEAFILPDVNVLNAVSAESQLSVRYFPKRSNIPDSSVPSNGSKNSQTSDNQANSTFVIINPGRGRLLKDNAYPFCREHGVTLAVRPNNTPKQKLHQSLVTNGVMLELLNFSKVLCGTHTRIVYNLVKQNFSHEGNIRSFPLLVHKMMEKKSTFLTDEGRDNFRKERFHIPTNEPQPRQKRRQNLDTDYQELERLTVATKRSGMLGHTNSDVKEIWQKNDLTYTCPVDFQIEMQSGMQVGPETKSAVSLDVKQEEDEVFISPAQPQANGHNTHFFTHPPSIPKSIPDLCSEGKNLGIDAKTQKQKLWQRRAARGEQILTSLKVNDLFSDCREIGLDFNVGSGNKQNLDLQLLTNCIVLEIYRFANAMSKSLRIFLYDILKKNFTLVLQHELHERNFLFYIMTKEKKLQAHPKRNNVEFLSSAMHFPEVYNMVDVTGDFQDEQEVKTEQHWDSSASDASQQTDVEPHPFCKKLGLDLWSMEERPAKNKLDVSTITTGAVLEIFSLIRELCGSSREMVNDVLEHNFNLDLQSGSTEAAQVIKKWYTAQSLIMKKHPASKRINLWLASTVYRAEPQTGNNLESGGLNLGRDAFKEEVQEVSRDAFKEEVQEVSRDAFKEEVQEVKRIKSYHICKEIGLDLDIGSKSETKTKLDLRLLTRGVLLELHQYIEEKCNRYVPSLYKILEYNFDLSSQNHRKVEFAWSIASQVIAMAAKNSRNGNYVNKVFELPFEVSERSQITCKPEPEDGFCELHPEEYDDIMFVRELKPVDIEVEIE